MKRGDCFKRYVDLIMRKKHVQWEPQVNFLWDSNGDLLVDYVGRYEAFSDSVFHVLNRIGIRATAIPHENASRRGRYQSDYDAESKQMIAAIYAADIKAFGYFFAEERAHANIADPAVGR